MAEHNTEHKNPIECQSIILCNTPTIIQPEHDITILSAPKRYAVHCLSMQSEVFEIISLVGPQKVLKVRLVACEVNMHFMIGSGGKHDKEHSL